MKVVYLDPGLGRGKGHNFAMVHEFDHALAHGLGVELHHVLQSQATADVLSSLKGQIHNVVRIDGYTRLSPTDVLDGARRDALVAAAAADLARAPLAEADVLIMPTVYPLHLHALAQHVRLRPDCRVVLGLLLPCSFWAADALTERTLTGWMVEDINQLASSTQLLAYSETGTYRFGDNTVSMATLLPPIAEPNAQLIRELVARGASGRAAPTPPTLGFFGSPFGTKGFALLTDALQHIVQADVQPNMQVRIHLPPGHEALCNQLTDLAPWIRATSAATDNATYLRQMADVDVVWALYDPQEYSGKMSGIVPEAISLGKPLLLSEGCVALQDFLERQAPGAFVMASYDGGGIAAALGMGTAEWHHPGACARAHAPMMLEMKSMGRYLAVCGIH